ncbi:MAG: hypothetical protein JWN92_206, partial [Candidatus Acidoferrum typicum]|nr:hypothetical protein [Candidatus Acidoferrum typicum]
VVNIRIITPPISPVKLTPPVVAQFGSGKNEQLLAPKKGILYNRR